MRTQVTLRVFSLVCYMTSSTIHAELHATRGENFPVSKTKNK